jgi:hypothetical protein
VYKCTIHRWHLAYKRVKLAKSVQLISSRLLLRAVNTDMVIKLCNALWLALRPAQCTCRVMYLYADV